MKITSIPQLQNAVHLHSLRQDLAKDACRTNSSDEQSSDNFEEQHLDSSQVRFLDSSKAIDQATPAQLVKEIAAELDAMGVREEKADVTESNTLSRLYDVGSAVISFIFPAVQNPDFYEMPVSCPEEDSKDFEVAEKWRSKLQSFKQILEKISPQVAETDPLADEVWLMLHKINNALAKISWLDAYFNQCELLEKAMQAVNAQIYRQGMDKKGQLFLSSKPYQRLLEQIATFAQLPLLNKASGSNWKKRLEKKCHHQMQQAMYLAEDLLQAVYMEIEAEIAECKAHLKSVSKEINKSTDDFEQLLTGFYKHVLLLNSLQKPIHAYYKSNQGFFAKQTWPIVVEKHLKKHIQRFEKLKTSFANTFGDIHLKGSIYALYRKMLKFSSVELTTLKTHTNPLIFAGLKFLSTHVKATKDNPLHSLVNEMAITKKPEVLDKTMLVQMRLARKNLSWIKSKALAQRRNLVQNESCSPASEKVWRWFFSYLQTFSLIEGLIERYTPLASKWSGQLPENAVANSDFVTSIQSMLFAKKSTPKEYAKYHAQAQGRAVDESEEKFVQIFDKFLQGKEWVEEYQNTIISNKTSKPLHSWIQETIYPKMLQEHFEILIKEFQKTKPKSNKTRQQMQRQALYYLFKHVDDSEKSHKYIHKAKNLGDASYVDQFHAYLVERHSATEEKWRGLLLKNLTIGKGVHAKLENHLQQLSGELKGLQTQLISGNGINAYLLEQLTHTDDAVAILKQDMQKVSQDLPLATDSSKVQSQWLKKLELLRHKFVEIENLLEAVAEVHRNKDILPQFKLMGLLTAPLTNVDETLFMHFLGKDTSLENADNKIEDILHLQLKTVNSWIDFIEGHKENIVDSSLKAFKNSYRDNSELRKIVAHSVQIPLFLQLKESLETTIDGLNDKGNAIFCQLEDRQSKKACDQVKTELAKNPIYTQFEVLFNLKLLHDFHLQNKNIYEHSERKRNSAFIASRNFAKQIDAAYAKGIICPIELKFMRQLLSRIHASAVTAQTQSAEKLLSKKTLAFRDVPASELAVVNPANSLMPVHGSSMAFKINSIDNAYSALRDNIDAFKYETFATDASIFLKETKLANKAGLHQQVIAAIQEYLAKIHVNDACLTACQGNEESLILILKELSEEYALGLFKRNGEIFQEDRLTFLQLAAFQQALAQRVLNGQALHVFGDIFIKEINSECLFQSYDWQKNTQIVALNKFSTFDVFAMGSDRYLFNTLHRWIQKWQTSKTNELVSYISKLHPELVSLVKQPNVLAAYLLADKKLTLVDINSKEIAIEVQPLPIHLQLPKVFFHLRDMAYFLSYSFNHNQILPISEISPWNDIKITHTAKVLPPASLIDSKPISSYPLLPNSLPRIPPNEIPIEAGKLPVEIRAEARAEYAISSLPEMQVQQTINYYVNHLEKLTQLQHQRKLKHLFFDPNALASELSKGFQDNQKFIEDLNVFLRKAYNYFSVLQDFESLSFILEINHFTSEYIKQIATGKPVAPKQKSSFESNDQTPLFVADFVLPFLDSRKEWRHLLEKPLSASNRSTVARDFAHSYLFQPVLVAQDVEELYKALITYRITESTDNWRSREFDQTFNVFYFQKQKQLAKIFASPQAESILNAIYRSFDAITPIKKWKITESFPYFSSEDGAITIDLALGRILIEGKPQIHIPALLTKHVDIQKYCGDPQLLKFAQADADPLIPEADLYYTIGKSGRTHRLIHKRNNVLIVQTKFKDKWYEPVPKEVLDVLNLPKTFQNYELWFTQDPLNIAFVHSQTKQWEFSASDQANGKLKILSVDSQGLPIGLTVASIDFYRPYKDFFDAFENPQYIMPHIDANGLLSKVQFMRYNFSFSLDAQNRAVWSEDSNYYLASSRIDGKLNIANSVLYLLLEKEENGEKKHLILFPLAQLKPLTDSLSSETDVEMDSINGKYLSYPIDPKTGIPIPQNQLAKFYLAMVYLWKHQYEQAYELLDHQVFLINDKLTDDEVFILQAIARLNERNRDPHPKAAALRLKAIAILQRNIERYLHQSSVIFSTHLGTVLPFFWGDIEKCYDDYLIYLQNAADITNTSLGKAEERMLLKLLTNGIERQRRPAFFQKRMQDLKVEDSRLVAITYQESAFKDWDKKERIFQKEEGQVWESRPALNLLSEKNRLDMHLRALNREFWENLRPKHKESFEVFDYIKLAFQMSVNTATLHAVPFALKYFHADWNDLPASELQLERFYPVKFPYDRTKLPLLNEAFRRDYENVWRLPDMSYDEAKEFAFDFLKRHKVNLELLSFFVYDWDIENMMMGILCKIARESPEGSSEKLYNFLLMRVFRDRTRFPASLDKYIINNSENRNLFQHEIFEPLLSQFVFGPGEAKLTFSKEQAVMPRLEWNEFSPHLPYEFALGDLSYRKTTFLEALPATQQEKETFKQVQAILHDIFELPIADNIMKDGAADFKKQMEEYFSFEKLILQQYKITSIDHLKMARDEIKAELSSLKESESTLQMRIELLANRISDGEMNSDILSVRRIAGEVGIITHKQVLRAFARNTPAELLQLNPMLNQEHVVEIFTQMRAFLLVATRRQRFEVWQNLIEKLSTEIAEGASEAKIKQLLQEVGKEFSRNRVYDVIKKPFFLAAEYATGFLFTLEQLEGLDNLSPEMRNNAIEMMPSRGKTAVIMPLFGWLNAIENHLAISIVPETLLPSMRKKYENTVGNAFGQAVEVLEYDRHYPDEAVALQNVLDKLISVRLTHSVLLTTKEVINSLFLKFCEKISGVLDYLETHKVTIKDSTQGWWLNQVWGNEIDILLAILNEIIVHGKVLVDEGDVVFDPRLSSHYIIGKEDKDGLHHVFKSVVNDLFAYFDEERPDLFQALRGTEEDYHQKIKPSIIEDILNGRFNIQSASWQTFISEKDGITHTLIQNYLQGKVDRSTTEFVKKQNPEIQDIITVLHQELNNVLHFTASQTAGTSFGPSPHFEKLSKDLCEEEYVAHPYNEGNPRSNGTEHATQLVRLNLSHFLYRDKIPVKMVTEHVEELDKLNKAALINGEYLSLEETPYNKEFADLIDRCHPNLILGKLSIDDYKTITEIINKSGKKKRKFIDKYVASRIKVFPRQLNTDAQLFGILLEPDQQYTMSGTLWNWQTFANVMKAPKSSDTIVKTLFHYFKHPDSFKLTHIDDPRDGIAIEDIVASAQSTMQGHAFSIIDGDNLFEGNLSKAVVNNLLKVNHPQHPEIKRAVTFNTNNQISIIEVAGKDAKNELQLQEFAGDINALNREEYVTHIPKPYTTGTDFKLSPTMHALMTVGRDNVLRDVLQNLWRLREFDKLQRAFLFLTKKSRAFISTTLAKQGIVKPSEELNAVDFFKFSFIQESKRLGQDTFLAFKQKITAILLKPVVHKMVTASREDVLSLYHNFRHLFETVTPKRPYEIYAQPFEVLAKEDAVNREIEKIYDQNASTAVAANITASLFQTTGQNFDSNAYWKMVTPKINTLKEVETPRLPDMVTTAAHEHSKLRMVNTQAQQENNAHGENTHEKDSNQNVLNLVFRSPAPLENKEFVPLPHLSWPQGNRFFPEYFQNNDLIHPLNKALKDFPLIANRFHPNLLCSKNLCPFRPQTSFFTFFSQLFRRSKAAFFDDRKDFSQALLIQDKATDEVKLILLDQKEQQEWLHYLKQAYYEQYPGTDQQRRKFLQAIRERKAKFANEERTVWQQILRKAAQNHVNGAPDEGEVNSLILYDNKRGLRESDLDIVNWDSPDKWLVPILERPREEMQRLRKLRLALYDLKYGVYVQGQAFDRINTTTLEQNPLMIQLKSEAKFFQGDIFYSEEELNCLKDNLFKNATEAMIDFFHQRVLHWKPVSAEKLAASSITRLFQSLKKNTNVAQAKA